MYSIGQIGGDSILAKDYVGRFLSSPPNIGLVKDWEVVYIGGIIKIKVYFDTLYTKNLSVSSVLATNHFSILDFDITINLTYSIGG